MDEFDPRIVRISVDVAGVRKTYEGLDIRASGTRYGSPTQNECTVQIANIERETRNYLLTETSPQNANRVRKSITVEAGRQSFGLSKIFEGDIVAASISQPPDIILTIKALAGQFDKGNIIARSGATQTSLKTLAQGIAKDLGATLDFQAQEKSVGNYSFNGAAIKQIEKLAEAGNVDAFLDNGVLVIKDMLAPLQGRTRILNKRSGMIGIPELTEQGIKATFLLDAQTTLGSGMTIESEINPAANGEYTIFKLGFDISNRAEPFYWIAEGKRR